MRTAQWVLLACLLLGLTVVGSAADAQLRDLEDSLRENARGAEMVNLREEARQRARWLERQLSEGSPAAVYSNTGQLLRPAPPAEARDYQPPEQSVAILHIRRGALLHDVGKMGIPDSILLKPGPLDEDEWATMRLHPEYAKQMLSPLSYLRPAISIPYSHHERWDGTGYPQGLKGEAIPIGARMFAVIDVWDALNSDRPYRKAWPKDRIIDHMRERSGTHFDPKVLEVFLELVTRNSE